MNDLIELLSNYRKHCAQAMSPTQLVLPETMRNYPLYLVSALKTPVSEVTLSHTCRCLDFSKGVVLMKK